MKSKIFATILILIFIASTISVYAEQDINQKKNILNKILKQDKPKTQAIKNQENAEPNRLTRSTNQEKLDRIKEMKLYTSKKIQQLKKLPFKKELNFKARKIPLFDVKRAQDKINETKFRIKIAEDGHKTTKEEIKQIQKQRENCIEGTETCNKIENELNINYKKLLVHTSNVMIRTLENLKHRVSISEQIVGGQAEELMLEIDKRISELETIRDEIFTLKEDIPKEEIKQEKEIIKTEWKKTKELIKSINSKLVHAKHGGIVTKLNHFKLKLETVLEKLTEEGKDTKEIEDLIEEFESKIKLIEVEYNEMTQAFENNDILEANSNMKEAKELLKQTHQKIKEIIQEVKNINGEKILKEELQKE